MFCRCMSQTTNKVRYLPCFLGLIVQLRQRFCKPQIVRFNIFTISLLQIVVDIPVLQNEVRWCIILQHPSLECFVCLKLTRFPHFLVVMAPCCLAEVGFCYDNLITLPESLGSHLTFLCWCNVSTSESHNLTL